MATRIALAPTGSSTKDYWDKKGAITKHAFFKKEIRSWFKAFETAMEAGDLKGLKELGYLRADKPQSEQKLKEDFDLVSDYEESNEIGNN